MKKKAYILAFQRATNYGAVLQIFAFKKVLENHGLKVEVIDYIPPWMKVTLRNHPSIFSFVKRRIMNFTFKSFFKKLGLTSSKYRENNTLKENLVDGDFYFVGSDQVWNKNIMHNDPTYFLNFVPEGAKRIGYAISMGNTRFEEPFKSEAYSLIEKFDNISARETFVSRYINEKFPEVNVPVVLDPTLLLSFDDYSGISDKKTFRRDYIVVYSAMRDQRLYDLAFHLRKLTGLPIVNLGYHFKGADKHEYLKGPGNWLNRIRKAKYVITNSFHGTVFSILAKSKFFVVPNEKKTHKGLNARFVELLNSLGLSQQMISNETELEERFNQEINFEKAFKLLAKRRESSYIFIKEVINK